MTHDQILRTIEQYGVKSPQTHVILEAAIDHIRTIYPPEEAATAVLDFLQLLDWWIRATGVE